MKSDRTVWRYSTFKASILGCFQIGFARASTQDKLPVNGLPKLPIKRRPCPSRPSRHRQSRGSHPRPRTIFAISGLDPNGTIASNVLSFATDASTTQPLPEDTTGKWAPHQPRLVMPFSSLNNDDDARSILLRDDIQSIHVRDLERVQARGCTSIRARPRFHAQQPARHRATSTARTETDCLTEAAKQVLRFPGRKEALAAIHSLPNCKNATPVLDLSAPRFQHIYSAGTCFGANSVPNEAPFRRIT